MHFKMLLSLVAYRLQAWDFFFYAATKSSIHSLYFNTPNDRSPSRDRDIVRCFPHFI